MPSNSYAEEGVTVTAEGDELVVVSSERTRGSKAPFYGLYHAEDRSRRFGWFCANCESAATVMDPMGRIECTDCGNRRRATRWDAGYL